MGPSIQKEKNGHASDGAFLGRLDSTMADRKPNANRG